METTLKTPKNGSAKRRIGVRDVAQLAGVGHPTVSVVLNGAKSNIRISDVTRQRILDAAKELDYRPNLAARSMSSGKSMLAGVLVGNEPHNSLTHPLNWAFVLGINDGLAHSGYSSILVRLTDVVEGNGLQAPVFQGHLLDGLIVAGPIPESVENSVEGLVPRCIWLDANVWREHNCIRRDEVYAGLLAVQHAAEAGYNRVVTFKTPEQNHYSWAERLQGVQQGIEQFGLQQHEWMVPFFLPNPELPKNWEPDWERMEAFIKTLQPQDAVILLSAYDASNFLEVCGMSGLKAGQDFGVVCCDEQFRGAGLDWMQLSRVEFDRYAMGEKAAKMLLDLLSNPDTPVPSQKVRGQFVTKATLSSATLFKDKEVLD
jgi:LacI family transcriptional regulator